MRYKDILDISTAVEMSFLRSIFLCLLFAVFLVKASPVEEDDSCMLWKWLTFVLSRSGIYLVGVIFVVFSFLATAVKNKIDPASWDKSHLRERGFNTMGFNGMNDDDIGSIKGRLREAEVTVTALKAELEETQRTKINLENSLEELERDRSISEEQLLKSKMEGAVELDALKKENSGLGQQLERARTDVNALNKQIESLRREVRISEAALRDQQSLTERLESTRSELEAINSQFKSNYRILESCRRELKRMMQDEGGTNRNPDRLMSSPPTINFDSDSRIEEETSNFNRTDVHTHKNAIGDAPMANHQNCRDETYNLTSETSTYSNLDRTGSTSDDCSDEENDPHRIVTGSSAFRTFIRTTYGR